MPLGRVAADGAVVDRHASIVADPPPPWLAELPLRVQALIVTCHPLKMPLPPKSAELLLKVVMATVVVPRQL